MEIAPEMVQLSEADMASLKQFAAVNLGLEVKTGHNGAQLRGMISKAAPDTAEIPQFVPEGTSAPRVQQASPQANQEAAIAQPVAMATEHVDPRHPANDPKVTLQVAKTADPVRAKACIISVNGEVTQIERGQAVTVPYRVYEALLNAKEMAPVDTNEINPHTGDPIRGWEEVQAYPFTVIELPGREEVEAWRKSVGASFQKKAA